MTKIGFSNSSRFILTDTDFYNGFVSKVDVVQGQYGPGLKFFTTILDAVPLKQGEGDSLGKEINCVFWSQKKEKFDFPKTGKFANTIETLGAAKGLSVDVINGIKLGTQDVELLIGALCRVLVQNKDQSGETYSGIDPNQIKMPAEITLVKYNEFLSKNASNPQAPAAPVYQAPAAPVAPPVYQAPVAPPVYQAPAAPVYQAPAAPVAPPVYQAPAAPVYQAPAAPVAPGVPASIKDDELFN